MVLIHLQFILERLQIQRQVRALFQFIKLPPMSLYDADHAASLFNLQEPGFIYSRLTNPTVAALEEKLATLEGGRGGTVTSSGHAAETLALFPLMAPGMEVIVADKLYGGSINLMGKSYRKFGWNAVFVDTDNPEAFRKAVTEKTRAIFMKTLPIPVELLLTWKQLLKLLMKQECLWL